jgi:hypothetical protein
MNCAVHSEVPAVGFCRNCGKAMCETCRRDVRGILYCEDCLASTVAAPQAAATAASGPSPALAAVLGVIPGLGAVYNGEYLKALIHVLVFGTIIAMLERSSAEGFFVPLLIAFIFYMPIEAYRTAKARLEGRPVTSLFGDAGGQPIGAYVLIGLGVLFLLEQSGLQIFEVIGRFVGPALLIGLGLYLIRRQTGGRGGPGASGTGSQQP